MKYRVLAPYCQPERPFAFAPPESLISRFLCPVPAGLPDVTAWPPWRVRPEDFSDAVLEARARVQRDAGSLGYAATTQLIRAWFSDFDGAHGFIGNATVLTRILSVIRAISVGERFRGDMFFEFLAGARPRVVPVPGGNLDTLIWLAWRYVHAFSASAFELADELPAHTDGVTAATALFDFITRAGTVPAHDFARAGDHRVRDEELALWPGPPSDLRVPVRGAVRKLGGAVQRAMGDVADRRRTGHALYAFVKPDSSDARKYNFRAYCEVAAHVLDAVVTLLRIVGHVAALGRRIVCPLEKRVGLEYGAPVPFRVDQIAKRWSVCAKVLRDVADVEESILDGRFVESARVAGVEPWYWALAESDALDWVDEYAWVGVALEWGILPGETDNIQRAGPRCIPTHAGLLVPHELYRQPPAVIVEYPKREGDHGLDRRFAAVVETRRDPGQIPEPPAPGRDHFRWQEIWEE